MCIDDSLMGSKAVVIRIRFERMINFNRINKWTIKKLSKAYVSYC